MPRSWRRGALNPGKSWDALEPLEAPRLTPGQVRLKRVELIQEMVELLHNDVDLSWPAQRELQRLTEAMTGLQREVRGDAR